MKEQETEKIVTIILNKLTEYITNIVIEELRVHNSSEKKGRWITIKPNGEENKGRHLFLNEGETPLQAIERTYGKKEAQTASQTNIQLSPAAEAMKKQLDKLNVQNNPPASLLKPLSDEEIISKVGGGDMTKGSCVSASYAYVGNKAGLDVRDFRGGVSCKFFSACRSVGKISKMEGIESHEEENGNDFNAAVSLVKKMKPNKEYLLAVGKHQAVIRKDEKGYKYLELQSPKENGWKILNNASLKERFKCQKSHSFYGEKYKVKSFLVDVESLSKSVDFKNLLGYINTQEGKEVKGAEGSIK